MSATSAPSVPPGKAEARGAGGRMKETVGLAPLVFLVIGAMIGGGAFSLPGDLAARGAHAGGVLLGWLITGVGIVMLALVFQNLSLRKPDLNAGIYSYARAGFGEFVGFSSAWGYWISAWLGNVAYLTLLFAAAGYFVPAFGQGNTPWAVLGASVILWAITALVARGVRESTLVNMVTTIAKIVPIVVFIIAAMLAFHPGVFRAAFWGPGGFHWGSVIEQARSTMMVTLWVFIGVEGAVVLSARARERRDIGRATVTGLLGTLVIYVLISVAAMGVMGQAQLAGLKSPSMAYVMESVVGPWGAALINAGLIVSLLGATLGWTLLAVEIPFVAAREGIFPAGFGRENEREAPIHSLWITQGLIQLFLIVVLFSSSTYQALYTMATAAILLPYLFSALYQVKLAWTGEAYGAHEPRTGDLVVGLVATAYAIWLIYGAGLDYLLLTGILYAVGILPYALVRHGQGKPLFQRYEGAIAALFVVMAVVAVYYVAHGWIQLT